jgi:hypothetical protein
MAEMYKSPATKAAEDKAEAADAKADAKASKADKADAKDERTESGMKPEVMLDDSGEAKLLVSGPKVDVPDEVKAEDKVEGRPVPGPGTDLYLTGGGYQVVPSGKTPEEMAAIPAGPGHYDYAKADAKDKDK